MMSSLRALAAAILLLLLLPVDALADSPGVQMQAEGGFEGRIKPGHWVPVVVTLKNEGAELEGVLEVKGSSQSPGSGTSKHEALYQTPVTLPAGGTKRVQLYLPESIIQAASITLLAGGEEVAEAQAPLEMSDDLLVGVLGVEPAELKGLASLEVGGRTARLIRLDPATLPAEALALKSLDAVLLDRFAWQELPEPQRLALQAWVEHGGTLIAAGGPEVKRLEGLTPFVPFSVKGTEMVDVAGVGSAPLALVDFPGAAIARRSGGHPLVYRYGKGAGDIYFLTFDPALEPFASWAGLRELFGGLLPGAQMMMPGRGPGPMMELMNSIQQFPVVQLPATGGLILLLGVYALLIGPVHLLLLRGFRRTGWALVTLPVLAAAGAGGGWAYLQRARSAEVLVNAVSVIEGQPQASSLRVRTMAGFYMPPGATYTAALGESLLSPVSVPVFSVPGAPPREVDLRTVLREGREAVLEPGEEWRLHTIAGEALVPQSGTVAGTLVIDEFRAKGQVTNRLPFGLKDAVIVGGTAYQRLGDLGPGETADVTLMLPVFSQEFGGPNQFTEAMSRAYQWRGWGPEGLTPEQAERMRRQQVAVGATQSLEWLNSADRPGFLLVGWSEEQPLPVSVDGKQVAAHSTSLYVQPIPYTLAEGPFTLPYNLLAPRQVDWNGRGAAPFMHPGWSLPKDVQVTLEFTSPPAAAGRVEEMKVRVPWLSRRPGTEYPMAFEFYRWSDGRWVQFKVEDQAAGPAAPAPFIGADGAVRVRLTQTNSEQMHMGTPGLLVRGKGGQP